MNTPLIRTMAIVRRLIPPAAVLACALAARSGPPLFIQDGIAPPFPQQGGAAGDVQLPHALMDSFNSRWEIQQDGSVGGTDLFDAGGQLFIGDGEYMSQQPAAKSNPKTGELIFAPTQMNGLNVSRRVLLNSKEGWCRWVEVVENPTAAPIKAQLRIHFDYNGVIEQIKEIQDERKKPVAFCIFDGNNHGIAAIGAGRGAKVTPTFQGQANNDQMWMIYEVDVPAKKSAAIVHVQAHRQNLNEVTRYAENAKDRDLLAGLPREVMKSVVNFKVHDQSVGDVDVLRGGLLDVVELRGGDQYRGTLKDAKYELDTAFGPVELPAAGVVGMITSGAFRPTQLFVTTDGQVIGGRLKGDVINLQLSSGQTTAVPLANITRLGYRLRPGEPQEWKFDKPMVYLRDGQRIEVAPPADTLLVSSVYGKLDLKPQSIGAITFPGEDTAVQQIRLTDGSRLAGLVANDPFSLQPKSLGGGKPADFPAATVNKLQLSRAGEDVSDESPTIALSNGDLLVGTLSGTIELETTFDTLRINGGEVRGVKHAPAPEDTLAAHTELQVILWDGATLSGRLKAESLPCILGSGVALRVPVGLLTEYQQPNPLPPAAMVEQIKSVVGELSNKDWKVRDRAANRLIQQGPSVAAVLKTLRQGQPAEAQKQIDSILKKLEDAKKAAKAPPPVLNKDELLELNKDVDLPRVIGK